MCAEPTTDEQLPADDKAWDMDDKPGAYQRPVGSPFYEAQSPFARLCRSALLAGRTLQHHADLERRKTSRVRYNFSGVKQLLEDAHVLYDALGNDMTANPSSYFHLVAARCLNFSVVSLMLSMYATGESLCGVGPEWSEEKMAFQVTAMYNVQNIAALVRDFAADLFAFIALDENVVKTPPIVLDAFYLGSVAHHGVWKETGDPVAEGSLETTRSCLTRLSGRWRLGKQFLDMLESREITRIVGVNYCGGLGGIATMYPVMS